MKVIKLSSFIIGILLIVHFTILSKIQFIAWPEMLAYPYLLSKGFLLYQDIINPYPPLLSFALLFVYSKFGLSLLVLKVITFITIFVTDIILIVVMGRIFNLKTTLLTFAMFVLIQPSLEGNGLWFDLIITPLLILIYYLNYQLLINYPSTSPDIIGTIRGFASIFKKPRVRRGEAYQKNKSVIQYILLSGIILGFTFLIKQTSVFVFISIGIFYLIIFKRLSQKIKTLLLYCSIFILPLILVSFVFYKQGLFPDYLFWVYQYPFWHLRSPGFLLYPTIKQSIIITVLLLPSFYVLYKYRLDKRIFTVFFVLIPALLFSLPRFSYFHLQPVLPYICLLIAYLITKNYKNIKLVIAYSVIILLIFIYFFIKWVNRQPRFYDNQTINTAFYLSERLKDKQPVFFYNLPAQYFVISNLIPVKPWADTFPWYLETDFMQDRIIKSLDLEKTDYIIFKQFGDEGDNIPGSYKPQKIDSYIKSNFLYQEELFDNIWILKRRAT